MSPSDLAERFRQLINQSQFPCVGAKSAIAKGTLDVMIGRDIRSNWDDRRIYEGIDRIVQAYRKDQALFQSFAVLFEGPVDLDEKAFERFLWSRAESLTNKDTWLGAPHDARVNSDPEDPHFSLSFAGEAFFIVGLHPAASRPARRFERPVLVQSARPVRAASRAGALRKDEGQDNRKRCRVGGDTQSHTGEAWHHLGSASI